MDIGYGILVWFGDVRFFEVVRVHQVNHVIAATSRCLIFRIYFVAFCFVAFVENHHFIFYRHHHTHNLFYIFTSETIA